MSQTAPQHSSFRLQSEKQLSELDSQVLQYQHIKTGARLLVMLNQDQNKTFGISFQTPPTDDTGVAHIVEHCVLAGSRRYKTKEPFMDLALGSMQTFLNAMTYPDHTMYPVASRNDQDFRNLVDVYLDAVFYPRMLEDKRIFEQEGWHYELEQSSGPLTRSGVVYNEMKGAFGDPVERLYTRCMQELYADTPYAAISGGYPTSIPELSYENFVAFHQRYYHPSNSYIFLYGDLDLADYLDYLAQWLDDFEALEIDSHIPLSKARNPEDAILRWEESYPAGSQEADDYLAFGASTPGVTTAIDRLLLNLVADLYFNSEHSQVRQALLKSGACAELNAMSWCTQQGSLLSMIQGCDPKRIDELEKLFFEALERDLAQPLAPERLEAVLNVLELSQRECGGQAARGIYYFVRAFDTWNYGGDPLEALKIDEPLQALRELVAQGGVEAWARQFLLHNGLRCWGHLKADSTQAAREEAEQAEALAQILDSWTEEERQAVIENTKALKAWQQRPDTPEEKATIPQVKSRDIKPVLDTAPCQFYQADTQYLAELKIPSNGLAYFAWGWSLDGFDQADLPYLQLLTQLIGSVSTEHYSYQDLETQFQLYSGGFQTSIQIMSPWLSETSTGLESDQEALDLRFTYTSKCLYTHQDKLFHLIEEVLSKSLFTDEQRIKELLTSLKSRLENAIVNNGTSFAILRASAGHSAKAKLSDLCGGLAFFRQLCEWCREVKTEEGFKQLQSRLEACYERLLKSPYQVGSLGAEEDALPTLRQALVASSLSLGKSDLRDLDWRPLPSGETAFKPLDWKVDVQALREAYGAATQVQYIGQCWSERLPYKGAYIVAAHHLSGSHIHNEIRAQGGAYGSGFRIDNQGQLIGLSFRDPHLARTLGVFAQLPEVIESLELSPDELDRSIVGSIAAFDPLLTLEQQVRAAHGSLITGLVPAERERLLQEALQTQKEDIAALAPVLRKGSQGASYCVIGAMPNIQSEADRFEQIYELKQL